MQGNLTLEQAARMLPITVAVCTIWRWCVKGIHVRKAGQTVKLRCVFIGWKIFTTPDSLEEFIHRLTAARMGPFEPVIEDKPAPHPRQRMDPTVVDEIPRSAGI